MKENFNSICITGVASTIAALFGIEYKNVQKPIPELLDMAKEKFGFSDMGICDCVVMYNPDAIAMWIYDKCIKIMSIAESGKSLMKVKMQYLRT